MAAAAVIVAAADDYDNNQNNPYTVAALTWSVEKHIVHLEYKNYISFISRWSFESILRELSTSCIYYERLSCFVTAMANSGLSIVYITL
jgi:hypothetical protein